MQRLITGFFSVLLVSVSLVFGAFAAGNPCYDVGVAGWCNLFDDIIVQEEAAKGLIKVAMKEDLVDKNSYGYYEMKGTFDKAADGQYKYKDSAGAVHVFQFDGFDLPGGIIEKERAAIKLAVCKMYGGQGANNESVCYMDNPLSGVESAYLYNDLQQFGMYPRWVPESTRKVVGNQTTVVGSHYKFLPEIAYDDFDADDWSFYYGSEEIINPNVFKNLQIRNLESVIDYLSDYVILRFSMAGLLIDRFSCASSTIKIKNNTLAPDDFLPCSVMYYDPEKDMNLSVDFGFLFDDVAETKESVAAAGDAMLACAALGGSGSDKGVCAGFDENMCNALKIENSIDVEWNPDKGGCVMMAQQKYNRNQKIKNMAVATGGIVVGVFTLPVTGGASMIGVVAIIGGVATIIGTVATAVANVVMDANFSAALLGANKCLIDNCGGVIKTDDGYNVQKTVSCGCATEAVQNLAEAMIKFEGSFTEQNANTALYLMDVLLSAQVGTMQPICVQEIMENIDKSGWQNVANIGNSVALIGVILSVPSWFSGGANNLETVGARLTQNFKVNARNTKKVLLAIGKTNKISKLAAKLKKMSVSTVIALERLVKNNRVAGRQFNAFASKLSTADTAKQVMGIWAGLCPSKAFPCAETLTTFVDAFDNLCGVM